MYAIVFCLNDLTVINTYTLYLCLMSVQNGEHTIHNQMYNETINSMNWFRRQIINITPDKRITKCMNIFALPKMRLAFKYIFCQKLNELDYFSINTSLNLSSLLCNTYLMLAAKSMNLSVILFIYIQFAIFFLPKNVISNVFHVASTQHVHQYLKKKD